MESFDVKPELDKYSGKSIADTTTGIGKDMKKAVVGSGKSIAGLAKKTF